MYSRCDCPCPPSVLSGHSVVDFTPDTPGRVGVIGFADEAWPPTEPASVGRRGFRQVQPTSLFREVTPLSTGEQETLLLSVLRRNAQTELTGKCEKDRQKGTDGLVTAISLFAKPSEFMNTLNTSERFSVRRS